MKTGSPRQPARASAPAARHPGKPAQAGNTTPGLTAPASQDAGLIEYRSWLELLWAQRAAATAG